MADPGTEDVEGRVGRDAVEPAPELGARLECIQVLVRLQEGLLHHVLRIVFVSRHPIGQAEHRTGVAVYQGPEGHRVTRSGPGQNVRLGVVHPNHETLLSAGGCYGGGDEAVKIGSYARAGEPVRAEP